jgi:hypothetical protein
MVASPSTGFLAPIAVSVWKLYDGTSLFLSPPIWNSPNSHGPIHEPASHYNPHMSTPPHITPTGTPGFISTPLAIHAPTTTTTNFTSEEVNVTYPLKKKIIIKVINISKKKQTFVSL